MVGIGLGEGEGVEVWSGTRVVRMLISTGKKVGEEGSAPTAQTTSIIHSATSCTHRTTPIIHPTTSCTHRNSPSRHAFHHHILHPLHCSQHQSYDFLHLGCHATTTLLPSAIPPPLCTHRTTPVTYPTPPPSFCDSSTRFVKKGFRVSMFLLFR